MTQNKGTGARQGLLLQKGWWGWYLSWDLSENRNPNGHKEQKQQRQQVLSPRGAGRPGVRVGRHPEWRGEGLWVARLPVRGWEQRCHKPRCLVSLLSLSQVKPDSEPHLIHRLSKSFCHRPGPHWAVEMVGGALGEGCAVNAHEWKPLEGRNCRPRGLLFFPLPPAEPPGAGEEVQKTKAGCLPGSCFFWGTQPSETKEHKGLATCPGLGRRSGSNFRRLTLASAWSRSEESRKQDPFAVEIPQWLPCLTSVAAVHQVHFPGFVLGVADRGGGQRSPSSLLCTENFHLRSQTLDLLLTPSFQHRLRKKRT